MNKSVISVFPFMFWMLGMMTNAFINAFDSLASWLIMFIGLEIYLLFYIWFNYELYSEEDGNNKINV